VGHNTYYFSLVSYVHQLRGDRLNLGVAVWHPLYGGDFKFKSDLRCLDCIDPDADTANIENEFESIRSSLGGHGTSARSPLDDIANKYQHGLVVTSPCEATGASVDALMERLWGNLVAPDRPTRVKSPQASDKIFTRSFLDALTKVPRIADVIALKVDYVEKRTFKPVKIAASYVVGDHEDIWRAVTFRNLSSGHQANKAKAIFADSLEILGLDKGHRAHLKIAVQIPRPEYLGGEWDSSLDWLQREAETVVPVEDGKPFTEALQLAIGA